MRAILCPMNKKPNPIAIFKPGRFTAMSGAAFDFSESDLQASATAYDPAKHEAPLVVGHPKPDGPAYGWAASLNYSDNLLQAQPRDVSPEFADWVERKIYKKISASFYPPSHPANPVPGVFYLRHIGFLGAQPPAVKGLPDPVFADDDTDFLTIEFSEDTFVAATTMTDDEKTALAAEKLRLDTQRAKQEADFAESQSKIAEKIANIDAREAKLLEQEQAATRRELTEFAETQIKAGKLLPKDKSGCVDFMTHLADSTVVEFSEGDEKLSVGQLAWFKSFLAGLPKAIEFGEVGGKTGDNTNAGLSEDMLARKARVYHKAQTDAGFNISFAEAVDAVIAGEV